jgi:hypothetical protein
LFSHEGILYNRNMNNTEIQLELDEEDLVFLDVQLQFVRDSLENAREGVISDKSLSMKELLGVDAQATKWIDRCEVLLARVQKEKSDRGIG